MRSAILVFLPNSNYLLGTFDRANLKEWWIASGFENCEYIKKGQHTYGEESVAIAKKLDGTWSMFESHDDCQSWHEALNLAYEIYDVVPIAPGRLIINTATGFYESVRAGRTWTKILDLPPAPLAPAIANIGGGDILICTNGHYIWRSTDIARTWVKTCDMSTIPYMGRTNRSPDKTTQIEWSTGYRYDGRVTYPCVAGVCGAYVIVGHGPFLVESYDGGLTWNEGHNWDEMGTWYENGVLKWDTAQANLLFDRHTIWNASGSNTKLKTPVEFCVKQIIVSSNPTYDPYDALFLMRYDEIVPLAGYDKLYSRTFLGYMGGRGTPENPQYLNYMFQQALAADSNDLHAVEVLRPGESTFDRIVFSAQTKIDPNTGELLPSLKYSEDGGWNWIDVDLSDATIGPPDGGFDYPAMPYLGDNYSKLTWVYGVCNNVGAWSYTAGNRTQYMSYDMDVLRPLPVVKTLTYRADTRIKGTDIKSYQATVGWNILKTFQLDALVSQGDSEPYQADVMIEGDDIQIYWMHRYMEGYPVATYEMGALLLKSTFPELVLPQAFDVKFPAFSESGYPYDSREEEEV